jgi:protein-tyrosine phosphatase
MKISLDYTSSCVNFRDVGEWVNLISDKKVMPEGKLLRGGKIDFVKDPKDIGNPKTIINLRNGADPMNFEAEYLHFPMDNHIEKYNTTQKEVREWLNNIIRVFENENLKFPALIHCLSGKDRTGIVVATLLKILDIEESIILEEYELSDGEIHPDLLLQSIHDLGNLNEYFKRVNLEKIRDNIIN